MCEPRKEMVIVDVIYSGLAGPLHEKNFLEWNRLNFTQRPTLRGSGNIADSSSLLQREKGGGIYVLGFAIAGHNNKK
jgi:hypothetical protein